jgi:hypothetical protein
VLVLVALIAFFALAQPGWQFRLPGGDCDDIAVDGSGHLLLACHSDSKHFPGSAGSTGMDGYVVKLDPRTNRVVWSTPLRGSAHDAALRVAVDAHDNAYVAGYTESRDFPVSDGALQSRYGGEGDGFLAKLDPSGRLLYSTYIGGDGADQATDVAVGRQIHVAGMYSRPGRKEDAFVLSFDVNRPASARTVFFGGSHTEKATGIALDRRGQLLVTGYTYSTDLPVRGALQPALHGRNNAFLVKLDPVTGRIVFATYLGDGGESSAWGIALDAAGNAYLAGMTNGRGKGWQALVTKISGDGKRMLYSTAFGGSGDDTCGYDGHVIAVDPTGRAWLAGITGSRDLPVHNAYQASYGGGERDGFLAGFSPTGLPIYATYHGGEHRDLLDGLTLTPGGRLYATGVSITPRRYDTLLIGLTLPSDPGMLP